MKKAFSIVEIVVVMAIAAMLFSVGLAGLFVLRGAVDISAVAEKLKSDIRETQLGAISTKGSCSNDPLYPVPKMWGITLRTKDNAEKNSYVIRYFCPGAGGGWNESQKVYLESDLTTNVVGATEMNFVYNTPFASFFATKGSLAGGELQGLGREQEWQPNMTNLIATGPILITLKKGSDTMVLTVDSARGTIEIN